MKGRTPGPTGVKTDITLQYKPWNCLVHPDRILSKKDITDRAVTVSVEQCQMLGIHGIPGVEW